MKNKFRILVISLTLGLFIGISAISLAQPPNPPGEHGSSGPQAPGGGMAPIGSGIVILMSLGAAYVAKKVFNARKKLEE